MTRRFAVLALFLLLLPSLLSAQTVSFTGQSASAPTGTPDPSSTFVVSGANQWTWTDGVTCWFSPTSFTITVTVPSSSPRTVVFYMRDDDSTVRTQTISAPGTPVQPVANFHSGVYYSYSVTGPGSVPFTITFTNSGANAVLTSVFIYSAGTPPPPPPPSIKHQVTLNWNLSSGAASYNIYRNGSILASVVAPPYTDSAVTPGASYLYTVTSMSPGGESAPAYPAIVIPSP